MWKFANALSVDTGFERVGRKEGTYKARNPGGWGIEKEWSKERLQLSNTTRLLLLLAIFGVFENSWVYLEFPLKRWVYLEFSHIYIT